MADETEKPDSTAVGPQGDSEAAAVATAPPAAPKPAAQKKAARAKKAAPHITSLSPADDVTIIGVPIGNIPESEFDSLPFTPAELIATGHWKPNYSRGGAD